MARTFNRQPMQVGYPSKDNVKDYFFNHYEWNGVNDDKNFLEVDQHTFNDAMNVYMDSESLLRSRPSLKRVPSNLYNSSGTTVIASLQNILDFWVFGDYVVYYCQNITVNSTSYAYVLLFTKKIDNKTRILAISEDLSTLSASFVSSEIKLILSKRKIFVFTKYSLSYFDLDNIGYYVSSSEYYVDPIYIPITKTITPNTETEVSSANILTNQEIYVYLYENSLGINSKIYDKQVYFYLDGVKYDFTFTKYTGQVLVQKYIDADSNYSMVLYDNNTPGVYGEGPNIAISKDNVLAMFSISTRSLVLSTDGKTFESYSLPISAGKVLKPVKFSTDGSLVYVVTTTGIWWLSVYSDSGTGLKTYPTFTNVAFVYNTFTGQYSGYSIFESDLIYDVDIFEDCKLTVYFYSGPYYVVRIFDGTSERDASFGKSYWESEYFNTDTFDASRNLVTIKYSEETLYFKENSQLKSSIANVTIIKPYYTIIVLFTTNDYYAVGLCDYGYLSACKIENSVISIYCDYKNDTEYKVFKFIFDFSQNNNNAISIGTASNNICTIYPTDQDKVAEVSTTVDTNYAISARLYVFGDNKVVTPVAIFDMSNSIVTKFIVVNSTTHFVDIIAVTNFIYYTTKIFKLSGSSYMGEDFTNTQIYVNNITVPIEIYCKEITKYDENNQPVLYNFIVPEHYTELHNFYFAIDNTVMISSDKTDEDGNWQWYLPDNQKQNFNYHITGLHPISDDVVAVFMKDEIDYIMYDTNAKAYTYQKSKLQVGLPEGNNVITSLDGTTILFVTKRGLVGLGYQDFIASTEQALSYLSDSIFQWFSDWNTSAIRLHLHGFWLICYKRTTGDVWVYDIRNKSWWPCEYKHHISMKFVTDGTELLCLASNILFDFDRSDNNYYDTDGLSQQKINWHIVSQKLYLNAANYYKHIVNITLGIALDTIATNSQAAPTMNLEVCNYRKIRNVVDTENFSYNVDMIRTLVHRLNYFKVCEFQYKLSSDDDNVLQVPLSLANITVKYKIAGEVR